MNILHLKYAVEVEKYHSINKAAEKLYMGQPNLSRAIKELEESLNIKIFKRTSKGMIPTVEGKEFLNYARNILAQIDDMERIYKDNGEKKEKFSICVPHSSYILNAFAAFVQEIEPGDKVEILFKQTDAKTVIDNVAKSESNLGVVRYPVSVEYEYLDLFCAKGINHRSIAEFEYKITVSKNSCLLKNKHISFDNINKYIEIVSPAQWEVSKTLHEISKKGKAGLSGRKIYVEGYESQLELLAEIKDSYMWAAPVQKDVLDRYNLVQMSVSDNKRLYKDVLINKKKYRLSNYDKMFIDKLIQIKREL